MRQKGDGSGDDYRTGEKEVDQLIRCQFSFSRAAGRIFCPFASFLPLNQWTGSGRGHHLQPFRTEGSSAFFLIMLPTTDLRTKHGKIDQYSVGTVQCYKVIALRICLSRTIFPTALKD